MNGVTAVSRERSPDTTPATVIEPAPVRARRTVLLIAEETRRRVGAARATLLFTALFALLALALSYFGLAGQRATGFQGFTRVSASLFNLVVYLVPLCALIVGTAEITGRRESLALLLAQPVSRGQVLLGSYLGVASALGTALLIGLGGAGVIIALETGGEAMGSYLVLVGASFALMAAFLSIAFLLGVVLLDRLRAMAGAVVFWFLAVVGYDLILIGVTAVFRGVALKSMLLPAILANPVDICRVLVTLAAGRGALFGPAGASLVEVFGHAGGASVAVGALVIQVTVPLVFAWLVFRRRDL